MQTTYVFVYIWRFGLDDLETIGRNAYAIRFQNVFLNFFSKLENNNIHRKICYPDFE
jgi:hypothetical protein